MRMLVEEVAVLGYLYLVDLHAEPDVPLRRSELGLVLFLILSSILAELLQSREEGARGRPYDEVWLRLADHLPHSFSNCVFT